MSHRCAYAGRSDIGRVREVNEDRWTCDPDLGFFVVSDGIGGEFAGDVASSIVVDALPKLIRKNLGQRDLSCDEINAVIKDAICWVSEEMHGRSRHLPGLAGMGATVVMLLFWDGEVHVAHLGDSRAYLLRDGRLRQLTHDHSLVQLLFDSGEIARAEMEMHPAKGQLTRYVGMEGESLPEVQSMAAWPGDRFLICTDGLTAMLDNMQLEAVVSRIARLDELCQSLVDEANRRGGADNITAVVVDVVDGRGPLASSSLRASR